MGPTMGPVGPNNVGPTVDPRDPQLGPTVDSQDPQVGYGPHRGPVGPNNVGPTSGPHCGLTRPKSGSHRMWGPLN